MLTKLTIRNFKQFGEVEIPLENGVVFIGPNNSGKTSALQALTLWRAGLEKLSEKMLFGNPMGKSEEELLADNRLFDAMLDKIAVGPFSSKNKEEKPPRPRKQRRSGVVMNRLELTSLPTPALDMLWHGRKTRRGARLSRIDIIVEGVNLDSEWKCGLEFDTGGGDSFYCRPLRLEEEKNPRRMRVPHLAYATRVAMLPPMSGLTASEAELQPGRIDVLLGEGQTAQVLRNICYRICSESKEQWKPIASRMEELFGVRLLNPERVMSRGEIRMLYTEPRRGKKGVKFDLSSSGRGMQQVLLLLAFLQLNPNTALLLDEPDAHLEILRQRQIYRTLLEAAEERNSQIIAASHSEVLLNEAVERNSAVAFVGKRPHRFGADRKGEVLMALKTIGFDQYYHAEARGWVLYLEGATDLSILRAFAEKLGHPVLDFLDDVFVKYVCDSASDFPDESAPRHILARRHFYALREARPDFEGALLVDGDVKGLDPNAPLKEMQWRRREIENHLCGRRTLLEFAAASGTPDGAKKRRDAMEEEIKKLEYAAEIRGDPSPFSGEVKASDDFLSPLFRNFAKALKLPLELRKADFHKLVPFIPEDEIDPEIREKLDAIHAVAMMAKTPPPQDEPED